MENKTVNNPSTEGKAPENISNGTAATDTAATAETDTTKGTATEQNTNGTTPPAYPPIT